MSPSVGMESGYLHVYRWSSQLCEINSLEPFCLGLPRFSLKRMKLWRNCLKALFQSGRFLSGSFQPVCVGCGDAPHTCSSGTTVRAFSKPLTSIWLPPINIFLISWAEIPLLKRAGFTYPLNGNCYGRVSLVYRSPYFIHPTGRA